MLQADYQPCLELQMPASTIDHTELRRLIESEKVTQAKAAELLGCSVSCIERTCKRLGLQTQRSGPRSGEGHPDWNGGVTVISGYRHVWSNTHPHRSKRNYVAEHRLVAEAMLGRYLEPHEVVHHRNGDRLDNRPENLEVFAKNSDHLKHELKGRVPNWTEDGLRRMQEGIARSARKRKGIPRDQWTKSCG